jgi:hypothetical protein
MIRFYEKTYGRYFTDSENEWRQLDKLRKLEIEGMREIRRLIKEWDEKEREQQFDPQLVNQNSTLDNKEELIERMEFHKHLDKKVLPKRYFEGKSNDFIRSDFVKPNHDKSD